MHELSEEIQVKKLTRSILQLRLSQKIVDLLEEPEYSWLAKGPKYRDDNGVPVVRASLVNCELDRDIWQELRNPATIGLYPLGLSEIWEYYAHTTAIKVDKHGREPLFPTAKSYHWAKQRYNRALLISVMLPLAEGPLRDFAAQMESKRRGPLDVYNKWWTLMNQLLEKALERLTVDLVTADNAIILLTDRIVQEISTKAIPVTRQGNAHGPSKGGNFPHKSLAVLTGLGQFGLHRLIIRDELVENDVQRFLGPVRSMVIFDSEPLEEELNLLAGSWGKQVKVINNFQNVSQEAVSKRFCSYSQENAGCQSCLTACPSGAIYSSSPLPNGEFPEQVASSQHRFHAGMLQFDYNRCIQERSKFSEMTGDWACSRCFVACAVIGKRDSETVKRFYEQYPHLR